MLNWVLEKSINKKKVSDLLQLSLDSNNSQIMNQMFKCLKNTQEINLKLMTINQ